MDEEGNWWYFSKAEHRARVRRRLDKEEPFMVVGPPPCVDFCVLNQNCNHKKMDPERVRRRMIVARPLCVQQGCQYYMGFIRKSRDPALYADPEDAILHGLYSEKLCPGSLVHCKSVNITGAF